MADARQQDQAAAALAAATPSDTTLQIAAAKADAFFAWLGNLSTPASGQSDSPYVLFRTAEAQAQAQSENGLAAAQAALGKKQALAGAIDAIAVALQERDRTNGLAAVQDTSDRTAVADQDALALSAAQSMQQYAHEYVLADIDHQKAVADADLQLRDRQIPDANDPHQRDLDQQLHDQRIRDANYKWTVADDLAEFNWRSRAATAEQTFADDEAQREQDALASQASSQTEAVVEGNYSQLTAQAQQTEDLALADPFELAT